MTTPDNVSETIQKLAQQFGQVGSQLLAAYTKYIFTHGVTEVTMGAICFIISLTTLLISIKFWKRWGNEYKRYSDDRHNGDFEIIRSATLWGVCALVSLIFIFVAGSYLDVGFYEMIAPQGAAINSILH